MVNVMNTEVFLNEMNELLHSYSNGRIPLNYLVARLETLNNALPSPSYEWTNKFFGLWFGLEEVNALLLDGNRRRPNPEEQHLLDTKLRELGSLIDSEFSYLTPGDQARE